MKSTLVLGASPNPSRYAYRAVQKLARAGHEVYPVGIREGEIEGLSIHTDRPQIDHLDTITLYVGPGRQSEYYDYIIGLKPKRIIFNPGTENPELMQLARANGIKTEMACTLVMLSTHEY